MGVALLVPIAGRASQDLCGDGVLAIPIRTTLRGGPWAQAVTSSAA